ncbi:hypothetical protein pdam_00006652 [Pocillopora damicornis]|uniref:Uncharacterized protein n=1 Tax=Pocillopora damicornis TaxID=46731 RepID=A0A3M6TKS2_POCDA|nr:hypothetical protein pdam_00006652 [Pocillopora damicornis]
MKVYNIYSLEKYTEKYQCSAMSLSSTGGPGFTYLSPTVYWYLATGDLKAALSKASCADVSNKALFPKSNFGHPVCPYLLYLVNTMPKRPLVSTLFCLEIETRDSSPKIPPGNSWSFRELISY